jgi:putative membrane protein
MPVTLLHSSHEVSWAAWHLEPTVIAGLFIVTGAYLYGLRFAGDGLQWWRPLSFFAGCAIIFLALVSPLDVASDRLLSMHMLQHVALTTVGPPLVLLGLPPETLRRLLPSGGRLFRVAGLITTPFIAAAVFIVNMWVWHIPPVYELALQHLSVHVVMHIAFLATGLLFWWPIVSPHPGLSPATGATRLVYLFATGFPMAVLALLLVSSQTVIYDFYENQPSRLWGVSPMADQQVAGIIMGSLGEAASFIAFSLIFLRYFLSDEPDASGAPGAAPSAGPSHS